MYNITVNGQPFGTETDAETPLLWVLRDEVKLKGTKFGCGIGKDEAMPGVLMPGFAQSLTDNDVAQLAAYLRRSRSHQPAWANLETAVARIRATDGAGKQ